MRNFHSDRTAGKRRIFRGSCAIAMVLVMVSGCRSTDDFSHIINEPMPLSSDARDGFGTIGLLPDSWAAALEFPEASSLNHPAPPWGRQTFNRLEAATRVDGDTRHRELANPVNFYDAGRVLGIGVIAGGAALAEGIFSSVPQAQLDISRTNVSAALNEMPLEKGITAQLRRIATASEIEHLVVVPESLLPIRGSQVLTNRAFHALTNAGIDTVLALRINNQQFGVVRRLNPPTVFAVQLDIYLFRVRDGSVAYFRSLDYQSEERKFTEWGARDAKYFRAELELAQQELARAVMTLLFDAEPPANETAASPSGP